MPQGGPVEGRQPEDGRRDPGPERGQTPSPQEKASYREEAQGSRHKNRPMNFKIEIISKMKPDVGPFPVILGHGLSKKP
jgi:hypothetical protein